MSKHTLVLNKAGVYEIRWSDGRRSQRKSTHSKDMSTALSYMQDWLSRSSKPHEPTVDEILERYLAEHVETRCADYERQRDCAASLRVGLGGLRPRELTHAALAQYKAARRAGLVNGRKVGDGTLRRELNCLVAAINHAVRHRRVPESDTPHIDLPAAPPPRDRYLSEGEAEQLWDAARRLGGRHFLFVAVAMETASRRHAVETLRWDQVDLAGGLIHFQHDGKRRTNKRKVAVPMSTRLREVLSEAKASATTEHVLGTPHSIQHCFDRVKAEALRATGNRLFAEISPHTLRHTWATLAARAGVSLFDIAGVLGDTVATVTRVYAHHSPDHLRGAVNFRSATTATQPACR